MLKLIKTCNACPEQYDVQDTSGKAVGYLRLRHGRFTAQVPGPGGETVYRASTHGDGMFEDDERDFHLGLAVQEILTRMNRHPSRDYVIELKE